MHTQTRPYRIGIDARFFRGGTSGLGRYTRQLIHYLAKVDQYNHYVVFLTEEDMAEWDVAQDNFEPRVVQATHYTVREQTVFLRELYRAKLDLVHFLNFNHPLLYRKPFVVTVHDLTIFRFPAGRSSASKMRRAAFQRVFAHSLHAAKSVIAISEFTAADVERSFHIPHARMEVVYEAGPYPVTEWPFGHKASTQQFIGRKEPYFLFVSQWRPHKGILTLIQAFNEFKKKTGSPHLLVLAGNQKTSEMEVRQALAESPYAGDIVTPGFVPDDMLPLLYHNAEALLYPSESEGFGLPALEAMAYGTPVIAADSTSLPEVVGNAGILVPTRDEMALAEAMERIVMEPSLAGELVAKGYRQAEKFSWDKAAYDTLGIYQRVLEKLR